MHESKLHDDEFESLWIKVKGKIQNHVLFRSHIDLEWDILLSTLLECVII